MLLIPYVSVVLCVAGLLMTLADNKPKVVEAGRAMLLAGLIGFAVLNASGLRLGH